ncbi:uncharacterized protein H6S33_002823 [Morchella sextelata]|uniref:uncharacterized protein n=1 Tax=Morchella sextelata TaxID=1174677 RepID=UPI001D045C09|nr:uncharacterized protein H6S33_002823 [Morchella sextelata]KAH0607789.1 hypothetical protein H6S33_002823 [Morchella sextelata]
MYCNQAHVNYPSHTPDRCTASSTSSTTLRSPIDTNLASNIYIVIHHTKKKELEIRTSNSGLLCYSAEENL